MIAIFAHRGAASSGTAGPSVDTAEPGWRDNTVAPFDAARRLGADGVELDVRRSADRTPVVHHDAHLPTGAPVGSLRAGELASWVPTLDQALDVLGGLAVNVELKHDEADPDRQLTTAVVRLLARRCEPLDPGAPGGPRPPATPPRVLVSSFDAVSLEAARRAVPEVPRGLLCNWRTDPHRALADAVGLGCGSLHPFVTQAVPALVEASAGAGLALHVWTVNADADLVAMARLGVAAVITDRVAAARSAREQSVRERMADG